MGTFDAAPEQVVETRTVWRKQFVGWRLDRYVFDGAAWFVDKGATGSYSPFEGSVPSHAECREARERHARAS